MFEKDLGKNTLKFTHDEHCRINNFIWSGAFKFIKKMNTKFNLDINFYDLREAYDDEISRTKGYFTNQPQSLNKIFNHAKFYKNMNATYLAKLTKKKDIELYKLYFNFFIAGQNLAITEIVNNRIQKISYRYAKKDKPKKIPRNFLTSVFIFHNVLLFIFLGPLANAIYCALALSMFAVYLFGKESKYSISMSSDLGTLKKHSTLADESYNKAKSRFKLQKAKFKKDNANNGKTNKEQNQPQQLSVQSQSRYSFQKLKKVQAKRVACPETRATKSLKT